MYDIENVKRRGLGIESEERSSHKLGGMKMIGKRS